MNFKKGTRTKTGKPSKMFKSANKVDTWSRMIHKWWLRYHAQPTSHTGGKDD